MASVNGATVAKVDVGPSSKPVFGKRDGKEVFMVRSNNSTVELAGQAALDYQLTCWPV